MTVAEPTINNLYLLFTTVMLFASAWICISIECTFQFLMAFLSKKMFAYRFTCSFTSLCLLQRSGADIIYWSSPGLIGQDVSRKRCWYLATYQQLWPFSVHWIYCPGEHDEIEHLTANGLIVDNRKDRFQLEPNGLLITDVQFQPNVKKIQKIHFIFRSQKLL